MSHSAAASPAKKATSATSTNNSDTDSSSSMGDRRDRVMRRMALDAIRRDAMNCWSSLRDEWKRDKEFVLTALQHMKTLPSKNDFERQFSQQLRFDRDVVLGFCHREDFPTLYQERHLYVPGHLTADRQVMFAYCSKIPRALQECCEDLCDDYQIVQAAIALEGLELQYASTRLREDRNLVMQACFKDGRALEFCPPQSKLRHELTHDRNFMLQVLKSNSQNNNRHYGSGSMLRLVAEPLRKDRELLLEALSHHGLRVQSCPYEYQNDKSFLLQVLERKSTLYLEFNPKIQADPDVALAAILAEDSSPEVHQRALEATASTSATLQYNRDVVLALTKRGDVEKLKSILIEQARKQPRQSFCEDVEIMAAVLQRDCKTFYPLVSQRLKQMNPQIIMATMNGDGGDTLAPHSILRDTPNAVLIEHPEIVVHAINVLNIGASSRHALRLLRMAIPDEVWNTSRDVCVAWIRRGFRIQDIFESRVRTDMEMALEVAKANENGGWREFHKVGDNFKSNLEFMERAIDLNGRVLRFASTPIRTNLKLIIRAIASHPEAAHGLLATSEHTATSTVVDDGMGGTVSLTITGLIQYITKQLEAHDTFLNEFLRGICVAGAKPPVRQPPSKRSHLHLLDRGVETSQALKMLIAAFVGIPLGTELKRMRTALHNLRNPRAMESSSGSNDDLMMALRIQDDLAFDDDWDWLFPLMANRHNQDGAGGNAGAAAAANARGAAGANARAAAGNGAAEMMARRRWVRRRRHFLHDRDHHRRIFHLLEEQQRFLEALQPGQQRNNRDQNNNNNNLVGRNNNNNNNNNNVAGRNNNYNNEREAVMALAEPFPRARGRDDNDFDDDDDDEDIEDVMMNMDDMDAEFMFHPGRGPGPGPGPGPRDIFADAGQPAAARPRLGNARMNHNETNNNNNNNGAPRAVAAAAARNDDNNINDDDGRDLFGRLRPRAAVAARDGNGAHRASLRRRNPAARLRYLDGAVGRRPPSPRRDDERGANGPAAAAAAAFNFADDDEESVMMDRRGNPLPEWMIR